MFTLIKSYMNFYAILYAKPTPNLRQTYRKHRVIQ